MDGPDRTEAWPQILTWKYFLMKNLISILALCLTIGGLHAQQTVAPALLAKNTHISLTNKYLAEDAPSAASPHDHSRHYGHSRARSTPTCNNVLTGSPVNLTVVNSYGCYAFGFTYERLFGPEQIIGIQVPTYFAYGARDWFGDSNDGRFYYTTPGVQVHVAGARHGFDYAVGPSILLGNLSERIYNYQRRRDEVFNSFTSGIILDNNLNFQRRAFIFGIHISVGTTFPNSTYNSRFFCQAGIRFGGRF